MEARAFGSGKKRMFFKPMKISGLDWLGLTFDILAVITATVAAWKGWTAYQYYPTFGQFALNGTESLVLAILLILVISIVTCGMGCQEAAF